MSVSNSSFETPIYFSYLLFVQCDKKVLLPSRSMFLYFKLKLPIGINHCVNTF